MTGKSTAAYEFVIALCEHDKTKRIGITSEYSYNILKGRGVPEECLIKCWERAEPEPTLWFDEFPFDGGY